MTGTAGPQRSVMALSTPALRAFGDGFGGALGGGLAYWLILTRFGRTGLDDAWVRIVILALVCGGFEMWRVARNRTSKSVVKSIFWTVTATLFLLWALEAATSPVDNSRQGAPSRFKLDPRARSLRNATVTATGQVTSGDHQPGTSKHLGNSVVLTRA